MGQFPINRDILPWGQKRLSMTQEEFARTLCVSEQTLRAWENGDKMPTYRQAQKIADKLFLPIGCLLLDSIPDISLEAVDFRTRNHQKMTRPSLELWATYQDAACRQQWYRDYAIENEYDPCNYVGSLTMDVPVSEAARRIRQTLGFSEQDIRTFKRWENYFSALVEAMEEHAGVLVMRNSMVGNNTGRLLSVEEFRGFAIADHYAPLIFINSRDSKNAQLFTLIHEFVHLLLGCSGISGDDLLASANNRIERYCNQVAGEYLVPEDSLLKAWKHANAKTSDNCEETVKTLAVSFHVSVMVMLVRCRELNLLSPQLVSLFWQHEQSAIRMTKAQQQGFSGNVYRTYANRLSPLFVRTVLHQVRSQDVQLGEAYRLLNVKNYDALMKLGNYVGVEP